MATPNAHKLIEMLLASMFCQRRSDRRQHSFMYKKPNNNSFVSTSNFELNYDIRGLLRTALFTRRNAAPYLRSLAVSDVERALTQFISDNFWIIGNDAFNGLFAHSRGASGAAFSEFVSTDNKVQLAEAVYSSNIFQEPRHLYAFPLVVIEVESEFESSQFFLIKPEGLKIDRLPHGYSEADIYSPSFPPFARWEGRRNLPTSWLGIWSPTLEIAKRNRAAILGALALLPHHMERYMFTMRKLFGGVATFNGSLVMTTSDPHTPALAESVVINETDHAWLAILADKITSSETIDKRQMRALEYYYRAWGPDPTRRFPILFGALDAIYNDAGHATQSVIEAIGPVMGEKYSYSRLKMLLGLRGSVIHGGAPNVYESSKYHRYYEAYEQDATRDLELIVARCLQAVVFGKAMTERPHTHAQLIKQKTGWEV